MAFSSNHPDASARIQDLEYLYASNTNVSNFVSVKLSGYGNYDLWKTQMLCLMKAHEMCWLVNDSPKDLSEKIREKYDSLLKVWIFGSVSEDVLRIVVDPKYSAKDVWNKLKSCFHSTMSSQQETETDDEVVDQAANFEDTNQISERADSARTKENMIKQLSEIIIEGELDELPHYMKRLKDVDWVRKRLNSDGNTILHMAVGISRNKALKEIIRKLDNHDLTEIKNNNGSTLLHIAAIVDNKKAAKLLVKKNKNLLNIKDSKGQTPLDKAYENMHFKTIAYLLKAAHDKKRKMATVFDAKSKKSSSRPPLPDVDFKKGLDILVQAISAKEYDLALDLLEQKPEYTVSSDNVLMALARTFPSGLDRGETLFYPCLNNTREMIVNKAKEFFSLSVDIPTKMIKVMGQILRCQNGFRKTVLNGIFFVRDGSRINHLFEHNCIFVIKNFVHAVPMVMVSWMYHLVLLFLMMFYFTFFMLYYLLWKATAIVVPSIKRIEQKKKEYEKVKKVLKLVCTTIKEKFPGGGHHHLYTKPILEAACQDCYEVVDKILGTWPEAIRCRNENSYDIIRLATIHRSCKIYNLIYIIGERKNIYRTMEDSSNNNMLHLAGRLAPSNKLKLRTGAALQLQGELQWRKEVEKLVFPAYITKENIFMETPEMVFTKEHENLVNEGEKWFKAVAESCSITAVLISTIVFAAAITIPGGNDQETGIPVFLREIVFTTFAISDAISLFSSITALLVFISILTARFAEKDFLVRLPRRLIIGLCTLLLSTTALMVSFSATLFLVFSHRKLWVLAPTCGLAILPIVFFCIVQFPLILDLFWSTYISEFGKRNHNGSKFNPNDIRFFYGK